MSRLLRSFAGVAARLTVCDGVGREWPGPARSPVKEGRVGDAIRDLPASLQTAMKPVTNAARVVLGQLRKAGPAEVEVEFGIDLAVQAGAVITKSHRPSELSVEAVSAGLTDPY